MSAYINTKTMEYPRHAGDIELDPEGTYEPLIIGGFPNFDTATQRCVAKTVEKIEGEWTIVWEVRDATQEEIDFANTPPSVLTPPR